MITKWERAKTSLTVLVMTETMCRSIWAYACESKGSEKQLIIKQILEDLEAIGMSEERVILKADQENNIRALLTWGVDRAAATILPLVQISLESAAKYDSQSNGFTEVSVFLVRGMFRTFKLCLEARIEM